MHTEVKLHEFYATLPKPETPSMPISVHMNIHSHSDPMFRISNRAYKAVELVWLPDYNGIALQSKIIVRLYFSVLDGIMK